MSKESSVHPPRNPIPDDTSISQAVAGKEGLIFERPLNILLNLETVKC